MARKRRETGVELDLGIDERDHGIWVESAHRFGHRPDEPVGVYFLLLRNRLLAEPGGFEGFGLVDEQFQSRELAILQRRKIAAPDRHLRFLRLETGADLDEDEHTVLTRVDEVNRGPPTSPRR
jgi:hypothetical protein